MHIRIIVERHEDGYVAYPIGIWGVIIGEGDTAEAAVADVTSAIKCHAETFGEASLWSDDRVLQVELREARV